MTDSFPRRSARSQRFTLGRPRSFSISPDGQTVLFLRSNAGDDRVHNLFAMDVATGKERCVVDVAALDVNDEDLPAAERARRERARESAGGIVSYATDTDCQRVCFALGGTAWVASIADGTLHAVDSDGPVFDVRLSPDGLRLAAVVDGGLHVGSVAGPLQPLVVEPGVTWGMAEHIAAEEMGRLRGYWWSPDSMSLLVARVDETDVAVAYIADPANPTVPAQEHRLPFAGTTNADVRLFLVEVDGGSRTEVIWDRGAYEYLATVTWESGHRPVISVISRDQRTAVFLEVADEGETEQVAVETDANWVEPVTGTPTWVGDELLRVRDDLQLGAGGTRCLVLGDRVVSPVGLQIRSVLGVVDDQVWATASTDDPACTDVVRIDPSTGEVTSIHSDGGETALSVATAVVGEGTRVEVVADMDGPARATVTTGEQRWPVKQHPLDPGVDVDVELLRLGERELRAALLRPTTPGPWPVLLDPYGGPHAQRVVASRHAYLTPAWFAAQGFAVLVIDGAGTPGRGPAFEREVFEDLASGPLQDQVDGLMAAAELEPNLDLTAVAIRGWSFGGYLAALACLRRPDVFRAGIVGAPVTDMRLYDTFYTERYLGHPGHNDEPYVRSGLVDPDARLTVAAATPSSADPALLVIHGLADDNVVAAHALRLSTALLAAGRPHQFLPLSGVTHMTSQEIVAENLMTVQRDFLLDALVG